MNTPVLLLVFNRFETTQRLLEAIRRAQPPRLYTTGDGPRPSRTGEAERVEAARRVATEVDWDCQVCTLGVRP